MSRAGIHTQTCLTPIDNLLTLSLSRGNTSSANYKPYTYHKIKWIKSSMVQSCHFIRSLQEWLQHKSPGLEFGAKRVLFEHERVLVKGNILNPRFLSCPFPRHFWTSQCDCLDKHLICDHEAVADQQVNHLNE